ncbi:MAG: GIY-YIG nuclease family protein [Oscillospiraceae bacterium]|nr:GIY-YIG nuclease family protein [Oscillospiraceae bacterium]
MAKEKGYIYILTNPSFKEYVKIGYADDVKMRLKQLNNSECIPFAFRIYATYEVEERLTDLKLHALIDQLNPNLRSIDNVDGKKRVREFYAMSPEQAYSILETIAVLGGRRDRLHLYDPSAEERKSENLAQEIEEEHIERLSPFAFSKCKIPVGATITFINQGNINSGAQCTVVDDKTVEYQGRKLSLSALATELTGSKWEVAGPRYFKYNGEWLNELRAKEEGRKISSRLDDVWVIPCNPKYYDIVEAFENLDVIEWSQSTNTTVGDKVYIYVGEKYKSIMFKCEVVAADQYGNRSTDDYVYYKDLKKDPGIRYMKLKLLEKYPVGKYPLKELKENGIKTVQGRSKATVQLMKYLDASDSIKS